ncbi:MAG: hypothetical protein ACJ78M_02195 [Gemmatimonadaceae bacterium]
MLVSQRRGFTIIDTVVVISVIGIVAAISGPKLSAALQRRTTASAADVFALTHALTRSTALRYGRIAQLHIDAPGNRFWVDVDTSANGVGQRATIGNVRDLSENGFQMTSTRSLVCFDARGLASTLGTCQSGDMKVVFLEGGLADTVTTTILGKLLR